MIKSTVLKLRSRVWARRLPKIITLTEFEPAGVRFEAISASELHRIVNRGWEEDYLAKMLAALKSDDVLYDIGANIGLVALHAASRCRTVAFEPDPGTFSRLSRNCELNLLASVKLVQVAVSDTDGQVTLFTDGIEGTSASLVHQRDELGSAKVEARTLDGLLSEGALPVPTVLKLDIEGAEILALRGGSRLLQGEHAPRLLFLEVHDAFLPGFGSSSEEVLGIVQEAGFDDVLYESRRAGERHLILGRR